MLLTEFPNIQWLKSEIEKSFSSQRSWDGRVLVKPEWPNVIINTKSTAAFRDNIKGPLSLFTNLSGESHVTLGSRKFTVGPANFLVSNSNQPYTLEIDQPLKVETFNIHFGESFTQDILTAIEFQGADWLEPSTESTNRKFVNRIQVKNAAIASIIYELKHSSVVLQFEESLHKLILHLVANEKELSSLYRKIPVVKKSSKVEIMKRMLHTADYIHAFSNHSLSLDELSKVATLSKFHFLRVFKATFGITPHQFTNKLRIEKAKHLLKNGQLNVKETAIDLGFENASSFSRLFRQETGVYPTQFQTLI